MFLVKWPDEMEFLSRFLPFPLNTVALVAGAFILFNIFYIVFVAKRFDERPRTAAVREAEPAAHGPA